MTIANVSGLIGDTGCCAALSGYVDTQIADLALDIGATGQANADCCATNTLSILSNANRITNVEINVLGVSGVALSNASRITNVEINLLGVSGLALSNSSRINLINNNLVGVSGLALANAACCTTNAADILTVSGLIGGAGGGTGCCAVNAADIITLSGLIGDTGCCDAVSGYFDGQISTLTTNLAATGQSNANRIQTNEAGISTLTTNLAATGQSNANRIQTNEAGISTLTTNLAATGQSNANRIQTNEAGISTLTTNLAATGQSNANRIQTNEAGISTLTTNLAATGQSNANRIQTNEAGISTLTTNLAATGQSNANRIQTNEAGISTNAANIATNVADIITLSGLIGDTGCCDAVSGYFDGQISTLTTNLAATGQSNANRITTNEAGVSTITTNLAATGQTNANGITTLTTNLAATGQANANDITTNAVNIATNTTLLATTGQTNANDITTLNTNVAAVGVNLAATGQANANLITTNAVNIETLTTNLAATGQTNANVTTTLTTNLAATGQANANVTTTNAAGIATLTTNLAATGQANANVTTTNAAGIATLTTNLAATGQANANVTTTNAAGIATLTTNLAATGQANANVTTTNAANIATNTTNIAATGAKNAADILIVSGLTGGGTTYTPGTGLILIGTEFSTSGTGYFDKVGIGTDSPDYALDVAGNMGVDEYIYHNGDEDTYMRFRSDKITIYAGNKSMVLIEEATNDKVEINSANQDIDFIVNGNGHADLFRVDAADKRIGMGTNNPSALLHCIPTANTEVGTIIQGASNQSADFLQLQDVNGDNKLSIDPSGLIGIGHAVNPTAPLYIDVDTTDLIYASGGGSIKNAKVTLAAGIGDTNNSLTLQLTSANAGNIYINLGDVNEPLAGRIRYKHADDELYLQTNTSSAVRWDSNQKRYDYAGSYGATESGNIAGGATRTLDLDGSNVQYVKLDGASTTLALQNVHAGQKFIVRIQQDATGGRSGVWWNGIRWANGIAQPTQGEGGHKATLYGFLCTTSGQYDGFVIASGLQH